MKRIRFSDLARDDLDEIWFSIAIDNVEAADRLVDKIDELLKKYLDFPSMGRERDDICVGVRSFPHGNYVIFYRMMDYGIAVLRVLHGARETEWLDFPLS